MIIKMTFAEHLFSGPMLSIILVSKYLNNKLVIWVLVLYPCYR